MGAFHEYSVVFSEPVAQGYAHPSLTEILVSLCHDSQRSQLASGKTEGVQEDEEYIEIDQDFMANSILPSIGCVAPFVPHIPTYKFATFRFGPGFPQVHTYPHRWYASHDRSAGRPYNTLEAFGPQQSWANQWGLGEPSPKSADHRLIVSEAIIGAVDTQTRRLVKVATYQDALPERYASLPVLGVDNM